MIWFISALPLYIVLLFMNITFVLCYTSVFVFSVTLLQKIGYIKIKFFSLLKLLLAFPVGILLTILTSTSSVVGNAAVGWRIAGKPSEEAMVLTGIIFLVSTGAYIILVCIPKKHIQNWINEN